MSDLSSKGSSRSSRVVSVALWVAIAIIGFVIYTAGISGNPPGFYLDESVLSYNAYLVATTGAGESGVHWPLFFQVYNDIFTQYSNPTQIYMLAGLFSVVGPSILAARLLAAGSMYVACIFLGLLAGRVSGRRFIGVIIGGTALITPWLFESGRLVLETFFYPAAVVILLWALYKAHTKETWKWFNVVAVALSLTLVTYSYTIGRLFGPLLALGIAVFITNRQRLVAVLVTWSLYALTLIPLFAFAKANPELSTRFYLLSYVKRTSGYGEIIAKFIPRFFEELNPWTLLIVGDDNARHHLPHSLGSILFGTFILACIGIVVIFSRHYANRWWLFIVYGLLASIVPSALTIDHAHTLRMIAYPIFLLLLMVPALEWMFDKGTQIAGEGSSFFVHRAKGIAALVLLGLTLMQAGYFHYRHYTEGASRGVAFDVSYKNLYDIAVAQPERPIFLLEDQSGPYYIHAFWYATVEGRSTSEFEHLKPGTKPAPGSLVLLGESDCQNCDKLAKEGVGVLYRARQEPSP